MKNLNLKIIILLAIILTALFGNNKQKEETEKNKNVIKEVSPDKGYEIMKKKGVIILDVREPAEFKAGKIKNAINIPLRQLQTEINRKVQDKKATILVYCRSGRRSMIATKILIDMGYTNVININGGILAWERSGFPIEK